MASFKLVRSRQGSGWPLSEQLSPADSLCRIMGLARGWKKMYCALLPFSRRVNQPVTELQLLFIDESLLTLTDKVWVTDSRSETCATRPRMHTNLVSPAVPPLVLIFASGVYTNIWFVFTLVNLIDGVTAFWPQNFCTCRVINWRCLLACCLSVQLLLVCLVQVLECWL